MESPLLEEFGVGDARERAESWRYSRNALRALEQQSFASADAAADLPAALIGRFDWSETRAVRFVFVNGAPAARYSSAGAGFTILHRGDVSTLRISGPGRLHLVFASVPGAAATRWKRDLEIEVECGAELTEQHVGSPGNDVLGAIECRTGISRGVEFATTVLSDLPDSVSLYRREQAAIASSATLRATYALFGGRFQRFDLNAAMTGDRARYVSRGVFALSGREHVDAHLDARHAARDTVSDVLWRGVADQRARGILHGAITVAPGADGADARLQTKNLLLSPHAEIDAQPVLEIHADEVKASHGATVGQLDELALFYLRSRGIAGADARDLLIAGFCREALAQVQGGDLAARLDAVLAERLPHARGAAP